jgi:hypothetical protein
LKELIPIPERMVDLCGDLAEDSARLLKALEENDERRANIARRDVNRHLQVSKKRDNLKVFSLLFCGQKESIEAIEKTAADGDKRAYLDKLKDSQERILRDLDPAVKKSLAKPNDKKALQNVEDLLEEARLNTLAIAGAVAEDLEYAAIAGAAKSNSAMRSLKQAANTADEEATETARINAESKTRRQAILADLLSMQTKDDKLRHNVFLCVFCWLLKKKNRWKGSLLEAGRDLSDVLRDLYGATNAALGEAGDEQLKGLVSDNREANQTIVDVIRLLYFLFLFLNFLFLKNNNIQGNYGSCWQNGSSGSSHQQPHSRAFVSSGRAPAFGSCWYR